MEETSLFSFFLSAPFRIKLRLGACALLAVAAVAGSATAIRDVLLIHAGVDPGISFRKAAPEAVPPFTIVYEMKDASVSLTSGRRLTSAFAQFTLVLDCPSEAVKHEMEMNRAKLQDLLFETASLFSLEDFQNADGFTAFKRTLQKTIDEKFAPRAPRDLAIRDWVVN